MMVMLMMVMIMIMTMVTRLGAVTEGSVATGAGFGLAWPD
jgi:hypothetical protein